MIKKYLFKHKSTIYLYLCVLVFFPLIQYLSGNSCIPVLYALLVISFLLLVYGIVNFIRFRSKMQFLEDMLEHLTAEQYPMCRPADAMEEKYQQMIESLYEAAKEYTENMRTEHIEQIEYYTMWVHQIKIPISAMRLALQSDKAASHQELMEQELFKIEQYVELALQYTKMKDLSSDIVISQYSLEQIVKQCIRKYASLFIYKKLYVHIENFEETVVTDSKWLSFLIEQVLSNAIKYTAQGGITISYVDQMLKITDTGIGIREEDIARIFERGFTGYNGRLDKKASGIGLYLADKVAKALSIRLKIISEVGSGTSVYFSFPDRNEFQEL